MNRSTATVAATAAPRAWRLPALLLMLAAWLVYHTLSARLPVAQWPGIVLSGADATLPQLVVRYGWLPRVAIALIAGAALSLAGGAPAPKPLSEKLQSSRLNQSPLLKLFLSIDLLRSVSMPAWK